LSPRTGRPTEDPKRHETRIRMSDEDIRILEYCCEVTGRTKADIIREGIREVYAKLKK
jgi:predicted DNA-binding protein